MPTENLLYYGDNLDVLRRYIRDESVDLVYLDPPFNSNASHNVLFGEADGSRSSAQVQAFEDTWHWGQAAPFHEDVVDRGGRVGEALEAFRQLLGRNDMLAYLSVMAPRLVELHRTLRPTGLLYLHCDPTASHYLDEGTSCHYLPPGEPACAAPEARYRKLPASVQGGAVFSRPEKTKWRCRNCGYIHQGKSAPKVCPACKHPQAYYGCWARTTSPRQPGLASGPAQNEDPVAPPPASAGGASRTVPP